MDALFGKEAKEFLKNQKKIAPRFSIDSLSRF
jgi:hypothetical protein